MVKIYTYEGNVFLLAVLHIIQHSKRNIEDKETLINKLSYLTPAWKRMLSQVVGIKDPSSTHYGFLSRWRCLPDSIEQPLEIQLSINDYINFLDTLMNLDIELVTEFDPFDWLS